jgi:hypothetical protein
MSPLQQETRRIIFVARRMMGENLRAACDQELDGVPKVRCPPGE